MIASTLRSRSVSVGLRVLRDLGFVSRAANSSRRSNSLLILAYHGLSLRDEHKWAPDLYLHPDVFRSRLACLRSMNASVLSLEEALRRLATNSLPPRSVVITFDDGFYDFLHHGVPILAEFGYPATLYLTTHYCHYRLPIIDLALSFILWKCGRSDVELPEFGIHNPVSIVTYGERQAVMRSILEWADRQHLETIAKDDIARQLADKLNVDYEELLRLRMFQILSPEEVNRVASSGIDVQLHTHRHRTPRDRALFFREITDNRSQIREMTGKNPVHFCYPSGDYASEFFGWLAECGIQSATTCEIGLAEAGSEWMRLPRVLDVNHMNPVRFETIIAGFLV
ncbi:MAG: polysaccharide deacetylase family protein [Acidobacteriaceae bacterium]|nr:polysaccharide deacetylase family protein [Acidobacteriaceae bacterium]